MTEIRLDNTLFIAGGKLQCRSIKQIWVMIGNLFVCLRLPKMYCCFYFSIWFAQRQFIVLINCIQFFGKFCASAVMCLKCFFFLETAIRQRKPPIHLISQFDPEQEQTNDKMSRDESKTAWRNRREGPTCPDRKNAGNGKSLWRITTARRSQGVLHNMKLQEYVLFPQIFHLCF